MARDPSPQRGFLSWPRPSLLFFLFSAVLMLVGAAGVMLPALRGDAGSDSLWPLLGMLHGYDLLLVGAAVVLLRLAQAVDDGEALAILTGLFAVTAALVLDLMAERSPDRALTAAGLGAAAGICVALGLRLGTRHPPGADWCLIAGAWLAWNLFSGPVLGRLHLGGSSLIDDAWAAGGAALLLLSAFTTEAWRSAGTTTMAHLWRLLLLALAVASLVHLVVQGRIFVSDLGAGDCLVLVPILVLCAHAVHAWPAVSLVAAPATALVLALTAAADGHHADLVHGVMTGAHPALLIVLAGAAWVFRARRERSRLLAWAAALHLVALVLALVDRVWACDTFWAGSLVALVVLARGRRHAGWLLGLVALLALWTGTTHLHDLLWSPIRRDLPPGLRLLLICSVAGAGLLAIVAVRPRLLHAAWLNRAAVLLHIGLLLPVLLAPREVFSGYGPLLPALALAALAGAARWRSGERRSLAILPLTLALALLDLIRLAGVDALPWLGMGVAAALIPCGVAWRLWTSRQSLPRQG